MRIKRYYWSIKRVLDYLPVIWNDSDFDYEGMYDLIEKKAERLRDTIKDDSSHVCSPDSVKEIEALLTMLRCLKDDGYMCPFNEYEKIHGVIPKIDIVFSKIEGVPDMQRSEFTYCPADFDKFYQDRKHQQPKAKLELHTAIFKCLDDKLRSWWT